MGDLEDLAAARMETSTRVIRPRRGHSPALYWAIGAAVVIALTFFIAAAKHGLANENEDEGDPPVLYADVVESWPPAKGFDSVSQNGELRTVIYRMVNLRMVFKPSRKIQGSPLVLVDVIDTVSGGHIHGPDAKNRLNELEDRRAAARLLEASAPKSDPSLFLQNGAKRVHVRGYYRRDGTYVPAHDRTR
jgi:hypothetical protein